MTSDARPLSTASNSADIPTSSATATTSTAMFRISLLTRSTSSRSNFGGSSL
eukprot:CAMPEP_0113408084 /NCGR_PEP_ID=MMETSP0013_2-20120614/20405_1 /TAXON_ID=2843 ORGANISM="Skeletonema costatum, Strain 1716" /NCGR_SAMPLE_ID=MMETSP0013_2 /ASSEMBLY_ACC=CAM_ASM_000158 /LENGTH=51 /DNA_ID=CAMNT_0000294071 /DNA_START=55 /DNA_END=206 /DNA_ORIENTATION=+ /assembly_acc=CAM_ASM_000158